MSDGHRELVRNPDGEAHLRYRSVSADVHQVGDELALLTSELWPGSVAISALGATLLQHCLPERSLREHADHAARALGLASGRELDAQIEALVRKGLLQRVRDSTEVAPGAPYSAAAEITTFAIVTADRPDYLARCLGSYLARLAGPPARLRVLVIDGSREADNQRKTEEQVGLAAASAQHQIEYAGAASRQSLRTQAVARGIASRVIDWLLPGAPPARSAGGGRNHLLLLTAGEAVLMVDDDTVCTPWRHEDHDDRIAFVGHVDPNDTRSFDDRSAALAAIHATTQNLLIAHQSLLGRRLADLAEDPGGRRDLRDVCRHLSPVFDGLRPTWTVRATWAGLAGDAGTRSPYSVLFSSGPTRDRLAAADGPAVALASREVIRSVRRRTVTDEPWFMTYCAALDGTMLLPPFSPVGTNEDGLFGTMLRMCDPTAFIGQIPYGIVHDSERTSSYGDDAIRLATDVRLADLVQWVSAPWAAASVEMDVSQRMRGLGRHLVECGRLDSNAWRAHLTRVVVDARRRLLVATESVLDDGFPYPPSWRDAIRRYQQAVLDKVTSPAACVPEEYRSCPSAEAAMDAVQHYVERFGEALVVWPDLWELCRASGAEYLVVKKP